MKSRIRAISTVICAFTLVSSVVVASEDRRSSTQEKETMKDQYQAIVAQLSAFPASHDVDALALVGRDIECLPITETTDSIKGKEQRRSKLELWLKVLNKIDQMIDQKFDPNDVPQMNIAPPPSTGLSAGASPNAIKDPKVRQEYEQAIRLNAEKAERYHVQNKLHELDKDWSSKASAYIKNQYTFQVQDIDEIKALIDTHLSGKGRKEQMKKEFCGAR